MISTTVALTVGESFAFRKVKEKAKRGEKRQAVKKPASSLQRYWRGWEDVRARTRSGKSSGSHVRLDL